MITGHAAYHHDGTVYYDNYPTITSQSIPQVGDLDAFRRFLDDVSRLSDWTLGAADSAPSPSSRSAHKVSLRLLFERSTCASSARTSASSDSKERP